MIYFPPCSTELLSDLSLPIVITEGEKKTLALHRVAWSGLGDSAEKPRFFALGLSGVWNFKGTIAKTVNASGHRQDVKGLIPDFKLLSWDCRRVIILYDANVKWNESVRVARDVLAKELKKLGAEVLIVDCPEISGCNGIDDVLGNWERTKGEQKAIRQCLELLESAESASEKKSSQVDQLLAIASDMDLFHTPEMEPFVAIEVKDHIEYHRINSLAFRQRLSYQFYKEEGKAPSSNAIQDTINALSGKALFEGPFHDIHLRVAARGGCIYIDLCNDKWQIIEISKLDWKVLESSAAPVRFNRNNAMRPLPSPIPNGDLTKLHKFLNVDSRNLVLILSWIINAYRPNYPFPILILSGEQGTAKSTTSRILRELIDPSKIPFRSSPKNEHDLIIAATRSWVIGLDNLSTIPDWFSDALCRLSTGGGFGTRKLYSDDEETILEAKRPIVINGIGDLASRSDLLDRALVVRLDSIPPDKRRSESEFWAEFEGEKESIFSGFLSAISIGLRRLDKINSGPMPRMADFTQWVTACEPALGLEKNAFRNVYNENRLNAHSIVLEDSLLAEGSRRTL